MNHLIETNQLKYKQTNSIIRRIDSISVPLYDHNRGKNFIKVNKSKLPSDWFPRSDSKKKTTLEKATENQLQKLNELYPKGYFMNFEEEKPERRAIQNKFLNRKFQTRELIKRNYKMDLRHFTPVSTPNRNQPLDIYSPAMDLNMILSQRIVHRSKRSNLKQTTLLNPQKLPNQGSFTQRKNQIEVDIKNIDPNNITFFNAKSTSFPPVFSKNIHK